MIAAENHLDPVARNTSWRHFSHAADMGIEVSSPSLNRAFEQAAVAMCQLITAADVLPRYQLQIHCRAPDLEGLLVDWLNSLVFEMASRGWLFGRFRVRIRDHSLSATVWGEPVDRERHQPVVEVKGATYTALMVQQDDAGLWHVRCVVDV